MMHECTTKTSPLRRRTLMRTLVSRKLAEPESSSASVFRQRLGNQGMQRLVVRELTPTTGARSHSTSDARDVQHKLTVSNSGDASEREADRIADQVMRMPNPQVQCAAACGTGCAKCETQQTDQQHESLQTKRLEPNNTGHIAAPPQVHEVIAARGQPLDPATRGFMEQRFGYDFSRVRVHSDAASAKSARDVNAYAYTVGHNIVFGTGRLVPETHEGRRLIAHELTHVVQQSNHSLRRTPILQKWSVGHLPTRADLLNKPDLLRNLPIKELFSIYATNKDEYTVHIYGPISYFFTISWIKGKGKLPLEKEITRRLSSISEKERIALINSIDAMHQDEFDSNRKGTLRDLTGEGLLLTYEQRKNLIEETRDRIVAAYTTFSTASVRKQSAIKSEIKEKADIVAVLFDVIMVFGGPALAKGIRYLANKLPITASNPAYRIALGGLDEARTKNIFSAATKVIKDTAKRNAESLFGESDIDVFIAALRDRFNTTQQVLREDVIPALTDEELGVIASAYDAEVATEDKYIREIEKLLTMYKKYVRPIERQVRKRGEIGWLGDVSVYETTYSYKIAAWIEGSSKKALAFVDYRVSFSGGFMSAPKIKFLGYVPPEMKAMALSKTAEVWRYGSAPTAHYSDVSEEIEAHYGASRLDSNAPVPESVMKTHVVLDK